MVSLNPRTSLWRRKVLPFQAVRTGLGTGSFQRVAAEADASREVDNSRWLSWLLRRLHYRKIAIPDYAVERGASRGRGRVIVKKSPSHDAKKESARPRARARRGGAELRPDPTLEAEEQWNHM